MQSSDHSYDVVVLGAGSAGSSAARAAKKAGASVAMVYIPSHRNLCIQRGCMPSKSLLAAAHVVHTAHNLGPFGSRLSGKVVPDLGDILQRKDEHVAYFNSFSEESLENAERGYATYHGRGTFVEGGKLQVETSEGTVEVEGKRYVIATGSHSFVPPIEGITETSYVTSDDIMDNKVREIPKRLLVLGGGPIGLEMGTFFASLGSHVTIVERGEFVSAFDPEFGKEMRKMLVERHQMNIVAPGNVVKVASHREGVIATVEAGGKEMAIEADLLLVATGRAANVEHLGVEHIGLRIEKGQFVTCDASMCTENTSVYAAGDVTKDMQILHVASEEGRVAGHNAGVGKSDKTIDYDALRMFVTFTDYPFAHAGLTEAEAKEKGVDVVSAVSTLPDSGRARTMSVSHGMWKMLADRKTGHIVGSTILGPRADDLIHLVFFAMRLRASVQELKTFATYHPTLSEQFNTLVSDLSDAITRRA